MRSSADRNVGVRRRRALRRAAIVMAAVAAGVTPALAQAPPPVNPVMYGSLTFGGQWLDVDGDAARLQRYRDLESGVRIARARQRYDTRTWGFDVAADRLGGDDQRVSAQATRYGRMKSWFEWTQIPLFYSELTATAYRRDGHPGVLTLDPGVRGSQASVGAAARPFTLASRRDTARAGLLLTPTPAWDLSLAVQSTSRTGEMPWSTSFGFSNVVEVPAPLDHRTTDLEAAAEWGNDAGSVRVQYDGSWFSNQVPALIWDNPLRTVDSPSAGSARGQSALWPDSTRHTMSVTGTVRAPARSRVTLTASVGAWNQDETLLPFTINSQIAPIPLERESAEAHAVVTSLGASVTSRPAPRVWFNVRYRLYDFDNQTPSLATPQAVSYDQTLQTLPLGRTEAFGYRRQWLDADVSYDLTTFLAASAGYGLEDVHRTFRSIETTTEHTLRTSLDTRGSAWITLRAVYEHGERTGDGFDEEVLDEIGEQTSLRQFDISSRRRDRVSAVAQITPIDAVGITGTVGISRDHRPDARFGLQEADARFYSLGVDYVPLEGVVAGLTWGLDRYTTLQQSRQAIPGPQFEDPTRDWTTDISDRVRTITASLDLVDVLPRTGVHASYDFSGSRGRYIYGLAPDTTLTAPTPLPDVTNDWHRVGADVEYRLTAGLALGLAYAYERYRIEDFALDTGTLSRLNMPSTLILGNAWRPYTAHLAWLHLACVW